MAAPADKSVKAGTTMGLDSQLEAMRQQVNFLTSCLRVLVAKLDLDAGVTDANYTALTTDAASGIAPSLTQSI